MISKSSATTDWVRTHGNTLGRILFADSRRVAPAPDRPTGQDMRRYLVAALAAALPCLGAAAHYLGPRIWLVFAAAFCSGSLVELSHALIEPLLLKLGDDG